MTKTKFIPVLVSHLAASFSHRLSEELGQEIMGQIRKRNRESQNADCCASHDFCDANVTMDEAFTEVMGRRMDLKSDEDMRLVNEAWDYAKAAGFKFFNPSTKSYRDRVLDTVEVLCKDELAKVKADENYDGSMQSMEAQQEILEMLSAGAGYDYEKSNDQDHEYRLKATAPEQWQYYLDTILPRLRSEK